MHLYKTDVAFSIAYHSHFGLHERLISYKAMESQFFRRRFLKSKLRMRLQSSFRRDTLSVESNVAALSAKASLDAAIAKKPTLKRKIQNIEVLLRTSKENL